jgi:4-carboxymuconolactone decarboxylase
MSQSKEPPQPQERLPFYVARALDSGVKPAEQSETVTHLAFYAGWSNAAAASEMR